MTSKKSAATRSAAEQLLVGWPLPAVVVARIECTRSRVARSSSPFRYSFVTMRAAPYAPRGASGSFFRPPTHGPPRRGLRQRLLVRRAFAVRIAARRIFTVGSARRGNFRHLLLHYVDGGHCLLGCRPDVPLGACRVGLSHEGSGRRLLRGI